MEINPSQYDLLLVGPLVHRMQTIIESRGYRVTARPKGSDGLMAIRSSTFHVILLELNVDDIETRDFLVAAKDEQPNAAYLLLDDPAKTGMIVSSMVQGVDAYLATPPDEANLFEAIARHALAAAARGGGSSELDQLRDTHDASSKQIDMLQRSMEEMQRQNQELDEEKAKLKFELTEARLETSKKLKLQKKNILQKTDSVEQQAYIASMELELTELKAERQELIQKLKDTGVDIEHEHGDLLDFAEVDAGDMDQSESAPREVSLEGPTETTENQVSDLIDIDESNEQDEQDALEDMIEISEEHDFAEPKKGDLDMRMGTENSDHADDALDKEDSVPEQHAIESILDEDLVSISPDSILEMAAESLSSEAPAPILIEEDGAGTISEEANLIEAALDALSVSNEDVKAEADAGESAQSEDSVEKEILGDGGAPPAIDFFEEEPEVLEKEASSEAAAERGQPEDPISSDDMDDDSAFDELTIQPGDVSLSSLMGDLAESDSGSDFSVLSQLGQPAVEESADSNKEMALEESEPADPFAPPSGGGIPDDDEPEEATRVAPMFSEIAPEAPLAEAALPRGQETPALGVPAFASGLADDAGDDEPEEATRVAPMFSEIAPEAPLAEAALPQGDETPILGVPAFTSGLAADAGDDFEEATRVAPMFSEIAPEAPLAEAALPQGDETPILGVPTFAPGLASGALDDEPEEATRVAPMFSEIAPEAPLAEAALPQGDETPILGVPTFAPGLADDADDDEPEEATRVAPMFSEIAPEAPLAEAALPRGQETPALGVPAFTSGLADDAGGEPNDLFENQVKAKGSVPMETLSSGTAVEGQPIAPEKNTPAAQDDDFGDATMVNVLMSELDIPVDLNIDAPVESPLMDLDDLVFDDDD
jgi:ActR/RegA family two-component response regulator